MRKTLIPRGNGWAIPTSKNIIKLLSIDPNSALLRFKIIDKVLYIKEIMPHDSDCDKSLIRKFSKVNTSWCLYLPNSIISLLEIIPNKDEIKIEVNDNVLIVRKALSD